MNLLTRLALLVRLLLRLRRFPLWSRRPPRAAVAAPASRWAFLGRRPPPETAAERDLRLLLDPNPLTVALSMYGTPRTVKTLANYPLWLPPLLRVLRGGNLKR